jgi:cytochrome P450
MDIPEGLRACVGTALARIKLQVATERLLRRFSDLASPSLPITTKRARQIHGRLYPIPVTW